jgi:hypothetical protein
MAYQLASYTDAYGTTHDAAYLRITKVDVHHKAAQAVVSFEVYASKTAAEDGSSQPLKSDGYAFVDGETSSTSSSSSTSTLYSANFATTLGTDPSGTQPTDVNDILQCQAYLALKNHPSLTTLLSGATVV